MQIGWFKSGFDRLIPWKERMFADIRASAAWRTGRIVRVDVKRSLNRVWIGLLPERRRVGAFLAAMRANVRAFLDELHRALG